MGEHNSPAYADGRADHETRNDALTGCPPIVLDTYDESKWGGPWMYRKGWASVPDALAHSCPRCREHAPVTVPPGPADDGQNGGYDSWA